MTTPRTAPYANVAGSPRAADPALAEANCGELFVCVVSVLVAYGLSRLCLTRWVWEALEEAPVCVRTAGPLAGEGTGTAPVDAR